METLNDQYKAKYALGIEEKKRVLYKGRTVTTLDIKRCGRCECVLKSITLEDGTEQYIEKDWCDICRSREPNVTGGCATCGREIPNPVTHYHSNGNFCNECIAIVSWKADLAYDLEKSGYSSRRLDAFSVKDIIKDYESQGAWNINKFLFSLGNILTEEIVEAYELLEKEKEEQILPAEPKEEISDEDYYKEMGF